MLKYIFLGATNFSRNLLEFLIQNNYKPEAIFYIPEEFKISWSEKPIKNVNFADLKTIAQQINIPAYEVNSIPGKKLNNYYGIIKEISPEVILVAGWYYIVSKKIRDIPKFGAWGTHASLLPKYAGNSPLVWAIINGETKTGVTLFKLDDGIDDGDIIYQEEFEIEENDTIVEVYNKALEVTKKLVLKAFQNINNLEFRKQDKSQIEIWPPRKQEDGLIDWNKTAKEIHNFIRAQTLPYPCAFSKYDGRIIKFVKSFPTDIPCTDFEPGTVHKINNNFLIATKDFFIRLFTIIVNEQVVNFEGFANEQIAQNKFIKFE